MSERIIAYCDFCNPTQSYSNGGYCRGTVEMTESDAIKFVDWIRKPDSRIMCIECQDDEENE